MADTRDLIAREGWQPTIRSRMAMLLGESMELAAEILRLPDGKLPDDDAHRKRIGHELYDVLWNLCDLARLTGVDLADASREHYPADAAGADGKSLRGVLGLQSAYVQRHVRMPTRGISERNPGTLSQPPG